MRFQSSSELAALIGAVVFGLEFGMLLLLDGEQQAIRSFTVALVSGIIMFGLSWWLLHKFIGSRVSILYRMIRKGKGQATAKAPSTKLSDAEKEVGNWVDEREIDRARMEQQEAYRKEFLGNIAHELKTPIFNIQGYILTLLEGGLEDQRINRDYLERAERGVERLIHVVQDLDGISKFELGQLELDLKRLDVVELAKETILEQTYRAEKRGVKLLFDRNYNVPIMVHCDEIKTAQVFTNLIVNSIKYGKESGTTEIRFSDFEQHIVVEIADDGIGMEQSELGRIFERFYRVEKSRARDRGGSGLGLSIVKHIVEAHGQTIMVRSTIDRGTTFSFTLAKI